MYTCFISVKLLSVVHNNHNDESFADVSRMLLQATRAMISVHVSLSLCTFRYCRAIGYSNNNSRPNNNNNNNKATIFEAL